MIINANTGKDAKMASTLVLPHPRPPSARRGVSAPLEARLPRNLKTALLEEAAGLTEKKMAREGKPDAESIE